MGLYGGYVINLVFPCHSQLRRVAEVGKWDFFPKGEGAKSNILGVSSQIWVVKKKFLFSGHDKGGPLTRVFLMAATLVVHF